MENCDPGTGQYETETVKNYGIGWNSKLNQSNLEWTSCDIDAAIQNKTTIMVRGARTETVHKNSTSSTNMHLTKGVL